MGCEVRGLQGTARQSGYGRRSRVRRRPGAGCYVMAGKREATYVGGDLVTSRGGSMRQAQRQFSATGHR